MSGKRLNVVWSVLTKRWVSYPATVHRCFVPALPITQPARLSGSTLDMSPKWIIPEKSTSNPLRSSLEQFNFLAEEVTGESGEAEQRGTGRAFPVMIMGFYSFWFLPVNLGSVLERFCWHCSLMSYRMIICSCAERGPSTSIWGEPFLKNNQKTAISEGTRRNKQHQTGVDRSH